MDSVAQHAERDLMASKRQGLLGFRTCFVDVSIGAAHSKELFSVILSS